MNVSYAARALALFEGYGGRDAMVAADGRRFTYRDLIDRVHAMAAALQELGYGPGKTIATLVTNPPESLALQLAAHLVGCRTAWIAPNAPAPFRTDFLRRSEAHAFVYDARQFKKGGRSLTEGTGLPVYGLGPGQFGPDLAAAPSVDRPPAASETPPVSLFQTSGTTGEPKMVQHGARFFDYLHDLSEAYLESGQPALRHLLIAGTWHISSQVAAFITLFTGGTLLIQVGVENGAFLELIERERVTSTLVTPPLLYSLLDDPRLAGADCSSLDTFTVSGSATAPARLAQAIERFGPVMRVTYGLSEAPFLTAFPNIHGERLGSCGLPYGDAKIEVRSESGEPLGPREPGEVWVSGSIVMDGYWNQPEQTGSTLQAGWLRTGDVGYLDEDGYLYLVDRVKDMVVTGKGSTNVFCRPVEDALLSHPGVHAAAVIGVPDPDLGEAVHAFVVPVAGETVSIAELRAHVAERLNDVWAPRSVDIVDGLPLTEYGKVDKKELRARYRDRDRVPVE